MNQDNRTTRTRVLSVNPAEKPLGAYFTIYETPEEPRPLTQLLAPGQKTGRKVRLLNFIARLLRM